MTQKLNKEIKLYLKQIKLLLPIKRKEEKAFLQQLQSAVEEFVDDNPNCTMEDIIERFEDPQTVVYNYISTIDPQKLCKGISIRKYIQRGIIIILLLATLFTAYRMILFYDVYLEAKNTNIVTEETVIS